MMMSFLVRQLGCVGLPQSHAVACIFEDTASQYFFEISQKPWCNRQALQKDHWRLPESVAADLQVSGHEKQ